MTRFGQDPAYVPHPAENDAGGCHPLMVCTDRPELCPPACWPVVRNAGANVIPPVVSHRLEHMPPGEGP